MKVYLIFNNTCLLGSYGQRTRVEIPETSLHWIQNLLGGSLEASKQQFRSICDPTVQKQDAWIMLGIRLIVTMIFAI